jgi:hypothetical protein
MRDELSEVDNKYHRYRSEVEDDSVDRNHRLEGRVRRGQLWQSNAKDDNDSVTEYTNASAGAESKPLAKMASLLNDFEHQRAAASPPITSIRVAWEEKLLYHDVNHRNQNSFSELNFQPFLDRILKYRHQEGQDDRWINLTFLSNLLTLQLHSQKTTPSAPHFSTTSSPGLLRSWLSHKLLGGDTLNLWRLAVPVLGSMRPLKPTISPGRRQSRQLQMLLFSDLIGRALRPNSSQIEEIE